MTTPAIKLAVPTMLLVYDRSCRIGFILRHGLAGVEAVNAADGSLGLFKTEDEAVVAVWRCAHKQPINN